MQITPVYFFKSFFLQNFFYNKFFFFLNLTFYYLYSIISLSYFLKIFKIIFLKKNVTKSNFIKTDIDYINNLNLSSIILYSLISFIFIYFLQDYNNFNLKPYSNYLILVYFLPFFLLNNIKIFKKNILVPIFIIFITSFFF